MALLKIEAYIEENCMSGNVNGTFALAVLKENFGFGESDEETEINISFAEDAERFAR